MGEIIQCDWCRASHRVEDMIPEEGDEWVCQECHRRDLEKHGPIGGGR